MEKKKSKSSNLTRAITALQRIARALEALVKAADRAWPSQEQIIDDLEDKHNFDLGADKRELKHQ